MRKFLLTFLILGSALAARSQTYGLYQTCTFTNSTGQAINGAQVYFLTQPANTVTLTPLASVYSTNTGGALTQPLKTDGYGSCTAYLSPGLYTVCFNSPYTGKRCFADQAISLGSSGSVTPGSGRALPAYPLGSAATVGPSNIAVDVTGNKLVFPSGGAITIPGCTGQAVAADGTGCVSTGGAPGGSNLQIQFNNSAAFGGATGLSTDSATKTFIYSGASASAVTPWADVRHPNYGAACNGTADDTAAIQAALTAAGGTGGSGTVFIPDGCHMANGSGLTSPNTALQLTLNVQGTLKVDSTFVLPRGVDLVCLSKGPKPQFATGAPTCIIQVANVYGTIGTAVTSTNTSVTIHPTFAGGSAANLVQNSAITIGAPMTCSTTGATRTLLAGTYPGAGPVNTTYSIGTCTDASGNAIAFRIPPAARITVTGCSDTSFNTPTGGLSSGIADFPGLTLSTRMVGAAATLADTSCSILGFNLDSFETVRIESVSSGTATIHTNHLHAATDKWGMVGMAGTFNDLSHKVIQGVSVTGNYGAGYWADANSMARFEGVSFQGYQYLTSIPMVFSSSWGWTFERSQTSSYSGYTCPTVSFNCAEIGPPFDVMMDLLPQSLFSENAVGSGIWGPNSTISIGMYITPSGYPAAYENGPVLNNSVIEQPMWNGITFDNRNTGAIYQTSIEDSLIQDNLVGWSQAAWVGYTDTSTSARRGTVAFYNNLNLAYTGVGNKPQTVNKYFCGEISVNGSSRYNSLVWPACPEATVTINDGRSFVGEMNTNQMGLSYIPFATKAVTTDPNAWTCSNVTGSGCTVTAGKLAPDGSTTAGEIFAGTGFAQVQIASGSFSTAAGDVFLYGAWSRCTDSFATGTVKFQTFGSDTFDATSNVNYSPVVQNLFWHSTVGMSIVQTGQAGGHTLVFYISPSDTAAGTTCQFWQPFVIQVPASSGVPIDEIQRWRTEALHGFVPQNLSAGQAMAFSKAIKLYWSHDVNLYRGTETATVTNVAVSAGTATITAANTFYAGEWVLFSGVGTNTWLNTNPSVQIASASSTQFTFATTHGNVASAADTGTATIGELKTDLTMDAKAYKVNGSYGTSGQYLQSTGNGQQWAVAPGLADPGSNGIVKRTSLGVTAAAGFADVVSTFASGSCTGFLKSDGTCVNGTFGGVTLTEWSSGGVKTAGASLTANGTQLWSFELPNGIVSTKISYTPSTADNTANLYDIGIYSGAGSLLCHVGATAGTTFAPNTSIVTLSWLSSCTLSGGTRYLLAITAVTATAVLNTGGLSIAAINRVLPTAGGTTSGGVLNSSMTPPADAPTAVNGFPQIFLW